MATLSKKWSPHDEKLGNKLLAEMKGLRGSFIEKATSAAKALGYSGYANMPEGVRMFIASVGGRNSRKNKKTESKKEATSKASTRASKKKGAHAEIVVETTMTKVTQEVSSEELARRQGLISQYMNDLGQNVSMQHCLHPEDEREILETVASGAAR